MRATIRKLMRQHSKDKKQDLSRVERLPDGWIKRTWQPAVYDQLQQYYRDDNCGLYVERNYHHQWRVVRRPTNTDGEPAEVIAIDLPLKAAKVVYVLEAAKGRR